MELDPPAELSEGVMRDIPGSREVDDRFTKHRGSIAASIESEEGWTRRPSLTSAFNSSEKLSGDA